VGQATILAREYKDRLRYSPATDFIVYNDSFWEESKPKAQAVSQELTSRQLMEARGEMKKAMDEMIKNGAADLLASMGSKKAGGSFNEEQARVFARYEAAAAYRKYAIKRRDSRFIAASLKEARPMLEIRQSDLDTDVFLLNTPTATYDLRSGTKMEHKPEHFITKETAVEPGTDGMDEWLDALDTFS